MQDRAYEKQNFVSLKKDNPSQRNCQNHLNLPSVPNLKQKYQESLIQGKICIQQNWNEDLKNW